MFSEPISLFLKIVTICGPVLAVYFQERPDVLKYLSGKLALTELDQLLSIDPREPPLENQYEKENPQPESKRVSHILTLDKNAYLEFFIDNNRGTFQLIWSVKRDDEKTASCLNHPSTSSPENECNSHYTIEQEHHAVGQTSTVSIKAAPTKTIQKFECNKQGCWITEKFMQIINPYWCILEQGYPIPESLELNESYYVGNYRCTSERRNQRTKRQSTERQGTRLDINQPAATMIDSASQSTPVDVIYIALNLILSKDTGSGLFFLNIEHNKYRYFQLSPWWTSYLPTAAYTVQTDQYSLSPSNDEFHPFRRNYMIWSHPFFYQEYQKNFEYRSSQLKPRPISECL